MDVTLWGVALQLDPSLGPYLAIADKINVLLLGIIFIVSLYRKTLVFGWLYTNCENDLKTCRNELSVKAAKLEAELEELRRERSATRK